MNDAYAKSAQDTCTQTKELNGKQITVVAATDRIFLYAVLTFRDAG